MSSLADNPYVGPRTFTREEADRFYGREQEANDLRALVVTERLVLFYAQSGAGKSSLINTRLIPQLQAGGFAVLPVGRVSGELPQGVDQVDNIFTFNLIQSLEQGDTDPARFNEMELSHFIAHLASDDGERYYYDDSPLPDEPEAGEAEPRHVLIIDQFEEIVTHHLDRWPEREAFFRQLNQAMADDPLLWVVLTLREDYIAALEPYAPLLADKMRARYYMQRMGTEAALQAVKRPAHDFGRPFAPDVAETLVDNLSQIRVHGRKKTVSGQFVEPVQLQVVCYEMWANLAGKRAGEITAYDLRKAGDVDSALADFYERAIAQTLRQTAVAENELREWFNERLITEGGTRGTVYQGETETAGLPNVVAESLANQFLLRAEMRSGGIWYELVHDRFVAPILKTNQAWQEQLLKEQAEKVRRRYRQLAIAIGLVLLLFLTGTLFVNSIFWRTRCLPDCPGAILTGLNLTTANLSRTNLSEANLAEANLSRTHLNGANLSDANLSEADLSGADLSGAFLNGADLRRANLSEADLSGAKLTRADLSEADLRFAHLNGADLNEANLSNAKIDDSTQLDDKWRLVWEIVNQGIEGRDLSGVDLSGVDLHGFDLNDANLSGANLSEADLWGAGLSGADLSGTDLSGADLRWIDLRGVNLNGANLSRANLSEAKIDDSTQLNDKWRLVWEIVNQGASGRDLSGANLSEANLTGVDLSDARLRGTDLSGADLSRANLTRADLSEASLSRANLESTGLRESILSGADLSGANLNGAKYNEDTVWPDSFDPVAAGAVLVE